jgi:hypothetical protein
VPGAESEIAVETIPDPSAPGQGGLKAAPPTVAGLAARKHHAADFLRSLGITEATTARGAPGLFVPYFQADGQPARGRMRCGLGAHPSYWLPPDSDPIVPYGLWLLRPRRDGRLAVVEGESDVWALACHGLNALGIPGSGLWKVLRAEHVAPFHSVFVSREDDGEPGAGFAAGVVGRLAHLSYPGRVFVVRFAGTGAKDVADLRCQDPAGFPRRWAERLYYAEEVVLPPPALAEQVRSLEKRLAEQESRGRRRDRLLAELVRRWKAVGRG